MIPQIPQTILEIKEFFIGMYSRWQMRGRRVSEEIWVFQEGTLKVLPRPKTIADLIVLLGLAESKSDATRLLKSKSIQQREWYGDDWWKPIEGLVESYPQWIRRGKKMYGAVTYMLPREGQTEYTWLELVNA